MEERKYTRIPRLSLYDKLKRWTKRLGGVKDENDVQCNIVFIKSAADDNKGVQERERLDRELRKDKRSERWTIVYTGIFKTGVLLTILTVFFFIFKQFFTSGFTELKSIVNATWWAVLLVVSLCAIIMNLNKFEIFVGRKKNVD